MYIMIELNVRIALRKEDEEHDLKAALALLFCLCFLHLKPSFLGS